MRVLCVNGHLGEVTTDFVRRERSCQVRGREGSIRQRVTLFLQKEGRKEGGRREREGGRSREN